MSYLGNQPGLTNYVFGLDRFNGTGACTQFTLTRTTDDANTLEVLVNSIQQDPINSYSVAAGLLTFTEAPSNGSNNIVVIYRSTATISYSNITTAQIGDGQVTQSKLAGSLANNNATAWNTANASFIQANSAFLKANTPDYVANSAAIYANGAFTQANLDFTNVSVGAGTYGNATVYPTITLAANGRVTAVGTASATIANGSITAAQLDFKSANGAGAVILPAGTTAQRPTGTSGSIRYNSTTGQFEGYTTSAWGSIGGGATGGGNDTVFFLNANTVTANYTISTGFNALSAGPITINSGVTVNISNGANWVVV
tara:strand:- start:1026 stop:1967 length:942 start_codon:yes stop_codon:yes gene_type:complete